MRRYADAPVFPVPALSFFMPSVYLVEVDLGGAAPPDTSHLTGSARGNAVQLLQLSPTPLLLFLVVVLRILNGGIDNSDRSFSSLGLCSSTPPVPPAFR